MYNLSSTLSTSCCTHLPTSDHSSLFAFISLLFHTRSPSGPLRVLPATSKGHSHAHGTDRFSQVPGMYIPISFPTKQPGKLLPGVGFLELHVHFSFSTIERLWCFCFLAVTSRQTMTIRSRVNIRLLLVDSYSQANV
jgi:hypothetical protein